MRITLIISFLLVSGAVWGQIDTRISPSPLPPAQTAPAEPASKWTGAPLTGFLSETLSSSLKEGLESSLAVSESTSNQYAGATSNPYGVDEYSRIDGTMSLHHDWSRSSLLMQYAGGTDMYVKNSNFHNEFHQAMANEALKLARWNLSLTEQFSYLPQSSFGFDPARSLGNGLAGGGDEGPDLFLPPNIIERGVSMQASAQYVLGARSSLSLTGAFNDLHFSGTAPGTLLADSQTATAGAQYSYALSAKDSIGFGYNFGQGRALGFGSLIQTHAALANLQHKLGQRLKLRVAAGPQFTIFSQNGIETNLGVSTTVNASAVYQLSSTKFGMSYFHGMNPGSGLFLGSNTEDIRAFLGRQIVRSLQVSVASGFSRNSNLAIPSINSAQRIDSMYVSATVERNFGRMISAYMSYSFQHEDANSALCNAAGCTQLPMFHTGTIGFRFHIHPLTMRP